MRSSEEIGELADDSLTQIIGEPLNRGEKLVVAVLHAANPNLASRCLPAQSERF